MAEQKGTLSIVATPIGNLEDITLRAIRTLREADVVFCEDTRQTKKLFSAHGIKTHVDSFHAHSTDAKVEKIMILLEAGKRVALVTDAGTPGISDPGTELVARVREKFGDAVKIEPIPGPSALTAALSSAGIPSNEFVFYGFLPHKKGRESIFKEIRGSERTSIFYESTHRIMKTLESLTAHVPTRRVVLARELTKIYEEFLSGTPSELMEILFRTPEKQKGEFVVLVSGM